MEEKSYTPHKIEKVPSLTEYSNMQNNHDFIMNCKETHGYRNDMPHVEVIANDAKRSLDEYEILTSANRSPIVKISQIKRTGKMLQNKSPHREITAKIVTDTHHSKSIFGKRSKPYSQYSSHNNTVSPLSNIQHQQLGHKKHNIKMLNPFNQRILLKTKQKQKLQMKKRRAEKIPKIAPPKNISMDIIVLESSENEWSNDSVNNFYNIKNNEDMDDVVILPNIPDPIYSIDSDSDKEISDRSNNNNNNNNSRLIDSPINSNASDDFIPHKDQIIEQEPFHGIADEEFSFMNLSVQTMQNIDTTEMSIDEEESSIQKENELAKKIPTFIKFIKSNDGASSSQQQKIGYRTNTAQTDLGIFARPKQTSELKENKSYEVADNCIAAIDVYESESSDMPESIKGIQSPQQISIPIKPAPHPSESDFSDLIINTANRSKRFTKRKASSSTKGSDYVLSDDEDEDGQPLAQLNDKSFNTNIPYICRGAVLNYTLNTQTRSKKLNKSKKKSQFEVISDEEFLSMLSAAVHGDNSDNEVADQSTKFLNKDESIINNKINETIKTATDLLHDQTVEIVNGNYYQGQDVESTVPSDSTNSNWTVTELKINESLKDTNEQESSAKMTWLVQDEIGDIDTEDMPIDILLNISGPNGNDDNYKEQQSQYNINVNAGIDSVDMSAVSSSATLTEQRQNTVQSCSLIVHPEMGWNDEMKAFYCNSWGGETFNVNAIQSSMTNGRYEWAICNEDRYPKHKRFNKSLRCINCFEMGHRTAQCKLPPRELTCFMCGRKGHRDTRCPNAICLQCGNKTNIFLQSCRRCVNAREIFCGLCRTLGHGPRDCPDKWRRYHSTTEANVALNKLLPLNKMPMSRNKFNLYCCICAGKGHIAEYCRSPLRSTKMIVSPSKIISYEQCYQTINFKNNPNAAPYAMISVPHPYFQFNWDVNEEVDRFYGRFLAATKFDRTKLSLMPIIYKKEKQTRLKHQAKKLKLTHQMVLNPFSRAAAVAATFTTTDRKSKHLTEHNAVVGDEKQVMSIHNDKTEPTFEQKMVKTNEESVVETGQENSTVCNEQKQSTVTKENKNLEFEKTKEKNLMEADAKIELSEKNKMETEEKDLFKTDGKIVNQNTSIEMEKSFVKKYAEIQMENKVKKIDNQQHKQEPLKVVVDKQIEMPNEINNSQGNQNIDHNTSNSSHTSTDQKICDAVTLNLVKDVDTNFSFQKAFIQMEEKLQSAMPSASATCTSTTLMSTENGSMVTESISQPLISTAFISPTLTLSSASSSSPTSRFDLSFIGATTPTSIKSSVSGNYKTAPTSNKTVDKPYSKNMQHDKAKSIDLFKFEDGMKMPNFIPLSASSKIHGGNQRRLMSTKQPINQQPLSKPLYTITDQKLSNNNDHLSIMTISVNTSAKRLSNCQPSNDTLSEQDRPCDAKIYLTNDHCKYLLNSKGSEFLRDETVKLNIVVNMEYGSHGNNLNIFGLPDAQTKFRQSFMAFCKRATQEVKRKFEISARVPKNRVVLMKFIQGQLLQLDKPLGKVKDLLTQMRLGEEMLTKNGTKKADRARKLLNMILIGQTGLRDGEKHLVALQTNLRYLKELKKDLVGENFRNQVFQHCRYIFSSYNHEDYPQMVSEYELLRRNNKLPVVNLDRKLLGFVNQQQQSSLAENTNNCDRKIISGSLETSIKNDIGGDDSISETISLNETNAIHTQEKQSLLKLESNQIIKEDSKQLSIPSTSSKTLQNLDVKMSSADKKSSSINHDEILDKITISCISQQTMPMASSFWSNICQKFINKLRTLQYFQLNSKSKEKLELIAEKAQNNKLSYSDYLGMMKLNDMIKEN